MKEIETSRLLLRKFKKTDVNDFYEYAKVPGVGESAGWPFHESIEVSKSILDNFIKSDEVYAIVYKENNKVIGSLGIHDRENDNLGIYLHPYEIGYVLSKDYWGKGLMTEAVKAAIRHCFSNTNIDLLWCGHFVENEKSRRVIEKVGFQFYGDGKYHSSAFNKDFDDKKYIMTKEIFQSLDWVCND